MVKRRIIDIIGGAADWLNRILAIARGERQARSVRLNVWEVE
ncbi:MAG TPA: hypothetical protein VFT69_18900 [Pseudolabrys sp.]|jgi:hypothetical protein|nr:hypothetical protein [Pseudolabrys sp.]